MPTVSGSSLHDNPQALALAEPPGGIAAPGSASLSLTLNVNASLVHSKDVVVYTAIVKNNGTDKAVAPIIVLDTPLGMNSAVYSVNNGETWIETENSLLTILLSDMYSGQTSVVLFRCVAPVGTRAVFYVTATITSHGNIRAQSPNTSAIPTSEIEFTMLSTLNYFGYFYQEYYYNIHIRNLGPANALTPVLTVTKNEDIDLRYVDDSILPSNYPVWPGSMTLATIEFGATVYVKLFCRIFYPISSSYPIILNGNVTSANYSTKPALATTGHARYVNTPRLALSATDGKASPIPGATFVYTITVINSGSYAAENLNFVPTISPELTDVKYNFNGSAWLSYTGQGKLPLPGRNLEKGRTAILYMEAKLSAGYGTGTFVSTFSLEITNYNENQEYSIASVVTRVGETAALFATNRADKTIYAPNEKIYYYLDVENRGPGIARAPAMRDTLPPSVENTLYSTDNGGSWRVWPSSNVITLPDIAANSAANIIFSANLTPRAASSLVHTAVFSTATPRPGGRTDEVFATTEGNLTIITDAVLSAVMTIGKEEYMPGDEVVYTIVITNNGSSVAVAPIVKDNLPAVLQNQRCRVEDSSDWQGWNGSVALPDMPAGGRAVLQIGGVLSPSAAGSLKNTATITTWTPRPDGTNPPLIVTTALNPAVIDTAELTLTNIADRPAAGRGDEIRYTVEIVNKGPAAAQNPVIIDAMPLCLENQKYSLNDGGIWWDWGGFLRLAYIPPDTPFTFDLKGIVSADAIGSLTNTAAVITCTPRPDGSLDSSGDSVTIPIK
ncbi:MAG: DUF11 domain-containing protein [Oscillospiraceae bacterium]|jgi:uncharacterized repeat protein (TIGR01451 family)|nr:DUF11 domain-containing protein [Oscillospiraceae bacterium]